MVESKQKKKSKEEQRQMFVYANSMHAFRLVAVVIGRIISVVMLMHGNSGVRHVNRAIYVRGKWIVVLMLMHGVLVIRSMCGRVR